MKQFPKLTAALLLSILVCLPSAFAVFYYTQPMEDASYDLSLFPEDGQEWEGNKGWTVYTNESGTITELAPNGGGGYLGLQYPGQTFYYSRTLTEELDSPMIQIGTVNQTVSIFLNDSMIYTDCPELDNRIGYLELPMLAYDRAEAVTVSLPPDYLGQTLTIAQSSPIYSDTESNTLTVWPCGVRLYCGYAYESGLIASAAKTMLPIVLMFALELFLLAAFIWNASVGNFSFRIPVFVLAIFFQICSILSKADFFSRYVGISSFDLTWLCFHLSVGTLLLFLALYTKQLRPLFLFCAVLQWCASLISLATQMGMILEYGDGYVFFMELPKIIGFFALLITLAGAFFLWKQGNRFFCHLSQAALIIITCYALFLVIGSPFFPDYVSSVFSRLKGELTGNLPNFSLRLIWNLCLISSLAAIVLELLEKETERRTELAVLSAKNQLAVESYENLCRQSEEVMMIRHDTMKHYSLLRTMAEESPKRLSGYLDELIGQIENIRPVVASQNQILNILINGKLNTAASKGISTEIVRSEAPEKLPLTDSELCCLVVNILDNAISAASVSKKPYIRLDFHCKDQHFVFSCENSMPDADERNIKTPSPEHGYGLKIIRQIMNRWGDNMMSIEEAENVYQITIVLPLSS
ncbi:MAG: GHKL domain-containing protein [Thermoflexaceae bacterium]|nr:GHKL domain-containing protein [Thermoflexaceae bacterium]